METLNDLLEPQSISSESIFDNSTLTCSDNDTMKISNSCSDLCTDNLAINFIQEYEQHPSSSKEIESLKESIESFVTFSIPSEFYNSNLDPQYDNIIATVFNAEGNSGTMINVKLIKLKICK